jgi:competence protein ComEC
VLRIHFLNVGHGDCTIIKHPSGRLTMIDINNSQDFDAGTFAEELAEERAKRPSYLGLGSPSSLGLGDAALYAAVAARAKNELTDPIEFMKANYPNESLWRFILTHPDLDHMRGLKLLHENTGFTNFWDTAHTKSTPTYRSGSADKVDWDFYQSLRRKLIDGVAIHNFTRGDSLYAFGKEQDGRPGGDSIEILSPSPELIGACNTAQKSNDLSIVIRLHHARRTVLLPGDAEELSWEGMRDYYGARLKSVFLKASHHGRDSGYHLEVLKLIAPLMTFVSCGRKPDTDASYKYREQTGNKKVPSTRFYGNIRLDINDDGSWKWFVDYNADKS